MSLQHCKCREEEQAAKTTAAKQEAKRQKKAKDKVKAQQAKLGTITTPADHLDAPSQPANGPSDVSNSAAVGSEPSPSHDRDAISPQATLGRRTGQQQHESEPRQPSESQVATAQPEAQQAGPSTSSHGHEHRWVEHAAVGSSETNELPPGPQARGEGANPPRATKQPSQPPASPQGEPLPPIEVPKRKKQRSKKGKQPANGLDALQPAASASSRDGSLPQPDTEAISTEAPRSDSLPEGLAATDVICGSAQSTPTAEIEHSSGPPEPASSAAAVMAAASGQSSLFKIAVRR